MSSDLNLTSLPLPVPADNSGDMAVRRMCVEVFGFVASHGLQPAEDKCREHHAKSECHVTDHVVPRSF